MPDVYALFGAPAKQSLSPWLHQQFAAQFALRIEYKICEVSAAALLPTLARFFASGGKGANVTAPYKHAVYQHLSKVSPNARAAKSVNTILVAENAELHGENTDGIGFLRDLQRKDIEVTGQNIVILGNGGAGRAIYAALESLKPACIHMLGRADYASLRNRTYHIVINATSAGLGGELPPLPPRV